MDRKLAHLQMIQGVIGRMAGNSFLLKGWTVALISALFALAAANARGGVVLLAYFPAIVFWLLDGYFVYQERSFRVLYDEVRQKADTNIDFSMVTATAPRGFDAWVSGVFSKTVWPFYVTILASILIVALAVLAF